MEGDSNSTRTQPNKVPKPPRNYPGRSVVWKHFTKYLDENGKQRARCIHCLTATFASQLKGTDGTSNMITHMNKCTSNPENSSTNQTKFAFTQENDVETGESKASLHSFRFDQKKARRAIAEMMIIDELPFKFVKKEGFKRCMKICQPSLFIPSRSTVTRDCYQLFTAEKAKLKSEMKKLVHRVSLMTDTWTSLQRINYMCLAAHYIDENWNLQKKVINLCPISSHRGVDIGESLEDCLVDWELQNIMTITADNASSNDVAINYLVRKMEKRGDGCILKGKWTHVRCATHVMNLIVQDGLKELGESVDRIRTLVRWVRISSARIKRFKEYALLGNVGCQKALVLDVPTRWNSTYMMLNVACEFQVAFEKYLDNDRVFHREIEDGCGLPTTVDWENVARLGVFL